MKNLIFDVSALVNCWVKAPSCAATAELLDSALHPGVKRWVVASSLPTLAYVAGTAFKRQGIEPKAVAHQLVPQLMNDLLNTVEVLSNFGFEQTTVYQQAQDFEDAQIAAAARSLGDQQVCVVTEDHHFDTLGEVLALSPHQALAWLQAPAAPPTADKPLPFIDLAAQQAQLRPQLEQGIERMLRHGQYIMGPEVKELEDKLAAFTGAKHCITCASGTEALLMSLMALGIGSGDEVITTPFTFVATAEMIVLSGAKPVFVDVEPDTGNINADLIEAAITPRTKAIMPVSLYGQTADMDAINTIAAKHGNLPVIEDAAQSFGATYKGRQSCNLSTIGCTSFFPSKPLGCYGDGGAIFTNDDTLAQAMREIRVHGQSQRYVHTRLGVGGRMDTLQCAIVLAKLERFDWEVQQRMAVGQRYTDQILSLRAWRSNPSPEDIQPPTIRPDRTSVYAQYTLMVPNREALQKRLTQAGIPTAVHYPVPINEQPAYSHLCCPDCTPVAQQLAKRVMSLPMSPGLNAVTQTQITSALKQALG